MVGLVPRIDVLCFTEQAGLGHLQAGDDCAIPMAHSARVSTPLAFAARNHRARKVYGLSCGPMVPEQV